MAVWPYIHTYVSTSVCLVPVLVLNYVTTGAFWPVNAKHPLCIHGIRSLQAGKRMGLRNKHTYLKLGEHSLRMSEVRHEVRESHHMYTGQGVE